jgi:hypothetical protein
MKLGNTTSERMRALTKPQVTQEAKLVCTVVPFGGEQVRTNEHPSKGGVRVRSRTPANSVRACSYVFACSDRLSGDRDKGNLGIATVLS